MVTSVVLACFVIIYTGVACVLALRISLSSKTNMAAVMVSVGLLILACGLASLIGFALVNSLGPDGGAFIAPFTPFTSVWFLVHPAALFDTPTEFADGALATRYVATFGSIIAAALYAFIVWNRYGALVRGFDMTMRKQSGT